MPKTNIPIAIPISFFMSFALFVELSVTFKISSVGYHLPEWFLNIPRALQVALSMARRSQCFIFFPTKARRKKGNIKGEKPPNETMREKRKQSIAKGFYEMNTMPQYVES
jgi:hypothetical protein